VASAAITDPEAPQRIVAGLRDYLRRHGLADISAVIAQVEGLEGVEVDGA